VLAFFVLGFAYSPHADAALPVWLSVSLVVAPYDFVYDHLLGIVPLALATGIVGKRSPRAALLVAAAGFFILVVGGTLLHAIPGVEHGTLSFNGIAQFALAAIVMAALWPDRRGERV